MHTERVSFLSRGARLVGILTRASDRRSPTVIVTGSWMTVKEQMPSNYVAPLVDAGFHVLTFDFCGFGESEGAPRDTESPHLKADDVGHAIGFLRSHSAVDPDRIGAVAICASAGYLAEASINEPRLKSLVMVAPWLHDAAIVREMYGGDTGVGEKIARALAAQETYTATGAVDYVPAASNTDKSAAMYQPGDALDYYLNASRGAVPAWPNRFAVMAWKEWLEFDPIALASQVTVPLRIVTSEKSATPEGSKRFASAMRTPPEIIWMPGTQFDFYDQPQTVAVAARHAVEHLRTTLC